MNKAVISKHILEQRPDMLLEWGWLGDTGPGVHVIGTNIYALLPIDDESDIRFADFIVDEYNKRSTLLNQ